jgi:hypothetical protein
MKGRYDTLTGQVIVLFELLREADLAARVRGTM